MWQKICFKTWQSSPVLLLTDPRRTFMLRKQWHKCPGSVSQFHVYIRCRCETLHFIVILPPKNEIMVCGTENFKN